MNIFQSNASRHRIAVHILALVGFIALVSGGMWCAVYATRFVPETVNRLGGTILHLGLILSPVATLGLNLSPADNALYWVLLFGVFLTFVYLFFFVAIPTANRYLHNFGSRVLTMLNAPRAVSAASTHTILPPQQELPKTSCGYSAYDGFKSFAPTSGALSVEDIVKGLSQKHSVVSSEHMKESATNDEPIFEDTEPIVHDSIAATDELAPAHDFTIALVEGDRAAVFAKLRQQINNAGTLERLMSAVICLLDEVYRARLDGTVCDIGIARATARLSTPTLEKLVDSLTTAIDSSYSLETTGAKLALIRALAVLGA